MKINKFLGVDNAKHAKGTAVVIDILRASTTAACFLDKGVKAIIPVSTKKEAFELKENHPDYILAGEEDYLKIDGFDFGNSPYEVSLAKNLEAKIVAQRTTRGTQGLLQVKHATEIIFGSFVCASATITYLEKTQPQEVSVVATMEIPGSEDEVFANYLIAKL